MPLVEQKYAISTANILDKAVVYGTLWPIGSHITVAKSAGFDGIELWPTKPTPLAQIRTNSLGEEDKSFILSAHQSPRTATLKEGILSPNKLPLVVFLPDLVRSLQDLESISVITGDLPVVLYKETPANFHQITKIQNRLIQPDPEVTTAWQVTNAQEFVDRLQEAGFTGICLDTNHLRRPHKELGTASPLASWNEVISTFLSNGMIKEVHVSVGRIDSPAIDRHATIAEVGDLINGTANTDVVRILRMIAESGWKGNVVLEVLPSAICELQNKPAVFLSREELINSYERIRESLYRIFEE